MIPEDLHLFVKEYALLGFKVQLLDSKNDRTVTMAEIDQADGLCFMYGTGADIDQDRHFDIRQESDNVWALEVGRSFLLRGTYQEVMAEIKRRVNQA